MLSSFRQLLMELVVNQVVVFILTLGSSLIFE